MPARTQVELLPIFRTDAQWQVLATLFVMRPDEELSIAELARLGALSNAAAQREVDRLVKAGLLRERRDGRNRLVSANLAHPAARGLRMILAQTAGPLLALGALYDLPGVEQVLIHGSWARRFQGEPGPFPHDVDVIVVGKADEIDVRLATQEIADDLGVSINVEVVDQRAWAHPKKGSVLDSIKRSDTEAVSRP